MKHNWQYKKLGEVGEIITGSTPDTSIKEYYNSSDFMFVKPGDINENGITQLKATESYVSALAFNKCCRKLPTNSILVTCIGTLGKVGILAKEATCNQQINAIIPNKCSAKFLAYAILSIRSALISKKNGPVVPIINKSRFSNLAIPLPPLAEQERIVAELDRINAVMEDCRQLLRTLDALAQSIFYESFGDPISNPKAWPTKKLEEVCLLKSGDSSANNLPEGDTPYIKVGDMNLDDNKYGIVTSTNHVNIGEKKKLLFPVGTTIFPKRGGAILTNKKRLIKVPVCCDLNIMGAIPQQINSIYLFYYFVLLDFKDLVDGSAVPQINNTDIYPLIVPLPPLELQQQFARRIEAIEAQKKAVEKTIATLQTLLDSRMDYWFN